MAAAAACIRHGDINGAAAVAPSVCEKNISAARHHLRKEKQTAANDISTISSGSAAAKHNVSASHLARKHAGRQRVAQALGGSKAGGGASASARSSKRGSQARE